MSPEGETKHEVTRERFKYESYLFIMGELCVCVEMWRRIDSIHSSHWLVSIQHRLAPAHFKAARGSKLYYCKLHHAVKCSSSVLRWKLVCTATRRRPLIVSCAEDCMMLDLFTRVRRSHFTLWEHFWFHLRSSPMQLSTLSGVAS